MSRSCRKPPVWIPHLTLENFEAMLGLLPNVELAIPVGHYFRNSLVASITSTLIALAIGTMGGYAFARYSFRGKATIFVAFMLSRTSRAWHCRCRCSSSGAGSA